MHIDDLAVRQWLQDRMEGTENRMQLDRKEQLRILTRLTDAVIFEEFIQKRFVGAKSFSLEGAESLIPLLGPGGRKGGRGWHSRNRDGHGASRPVECAGQHHRQEPATGLSRVRRCRPGDARRPRRREVSPRIQRRLDDRRRQEGAPLALLQSEPPGVRQSGRAGPHAGQTRPGARHRPHAAA